MMSVISVLSSDNMAASFSGFEAFGSFSSENIESYIANSDNLGNFRQ